MRACRNYPRFAFLCLLLMAALARAAEPGASPSAKARWEPNVFPISFWHGPPNDQITLERFQEIVKAGFTVVMPHVHGNAPTVEENRRILDYCQKLGVTAFIRDERLPRAPSAGDEWKGGIDAVVADFSDHPGLAGYHLADEPSAGAFPGLARIFAYLSEKDPAHPAYVNIYPNYCPPEGLGTPTYTEYVRKWMEVVNPAILSYDHYHFRSKFDEPLFFANLETIRNQALKSDVPFWQIVLLINHFDFRSPNEAEKRFEVFNTLAYGGKGIMYFTYWQPGKDWGEAIIQIDGTRTKQYDEVKRINRDLKALGNELLEAKSIGVMQQGRPGDQTNTEHDIPVSFPGPNITAGHFSKGAHQLMLLVNRDYRNDVATPTRIDTSGKPLQAFDRERKEWSSLASPGDDGTAQFELKLAPGDAALYRW